jgi:hypothetical protein
MFRRWWPAGYEDVLGGFAVLGLKRSDMAASWSYRGVISEFGLSVEMAPVMGFIPMAAKIWSRAIR